MALTTINIVIFNYKPSSAVPRDIMGAKWSDISITMDTLAWALQQEAAGTYWRRKHRPTLGDGSTLYLPGTTALFKHHRQRLINFERAHTVNGSMSRWCIDVEHFGVYFRSLTKVKDVKGFIWIFCC